MTTHTAADNTFRLAITGNFLLEALDMMLLSRRLGGVSSRVLALAVCARSMSSGPVKFLALRYTYVDGMLEKRQPYRQGHLDGLKAMADSGKCVLGGAFNDPCDGAVVLFDATKTTKEEIESFAQSDPYVTNNLVPSWSVSEYMAVVGSLKPDA